MVIIIKPQIIREKTKYQGYRINIPKSIMEANNWEKKKFKLEIKKNKIILTPI